MSSRLSCAGCLKTITNRLYLRCSLCSLSYDLDCANVPEKRYSRMGLEERNKYECHECRNKQPKRDNTNTPIRSLYSADTGEKHETQSVKHCNRVTGSTSSGCEENPKSSPTLNIHSSLMESIRNEIHLAVSEAVEKTVNSYFSKEFQSIKNELSSLKELKVSLEFLSGEYDRVQLELKACEVKITSLTKENVKLSDTVRDISSRLSLMEQHSRENNLEINGIPENKSENLVSIMKQLSNTLSIPLNENDIIMSTRVRKLDPNNKKPRAIIVKLLNTRTRDNVLAAVSKFNKANPTEKLHTGHLGYGGAKSPVFLSEHLSPHLKTLHAQTRQKARETGYKYVWVRNGRVFIRKDENSPAQQVKNVESLPAS